MVIDSPSARERRLAAELRRLREAAGLHGKDVAERLGWSASKISRIETGHTGINSADLERLLELYAAPDDIARLLRRLAPAARPRGWWDAYADTLSARFANLIRLESGSLALRGYAALVPHALLQSPGFLRELILATWERPSEAEIQRRMLISRRRQELLDTELQRTPLQFSTVVDESVLRRRVVPGDPDRDAAVRREQLEHLLSVGARPNVTVQVLPFSAGLPPVTAGAFSVLHSPATDGPDVVYLENRTRVFFVETEAEVHAYSRSYDLLASMALDQQDSRDLLAGLLAAL
jgi:transcriptional regulator with XRE-family HTH domain